MGAVVTVDLAGFIQARLDDDEQAATQGGINGARWDFTGASCEVRVREPDGNLGAIVARCREGRAIDFSNTIHIALNDPARVLREVAAKRAILDRHRRQAQQVWRDQRVVGEGPPFCGWCSGEREEDWPCPDVRALASVWSDHADYDPAWRP